MSEQAAHDQLSTPHAVPRPEPLPLVAETTAAPAYPIEALGPVLGEAARVIAECVQCPGAMAGQSVLAAAALTTQGLANVLIDGRSSPVSLFCLTVAESGDRKSGADELALSAHYQWQKDQRQTHKDEVIDHQAELAAYQTAYNRITKDRKKSKESITDELKELGAPPEAPLMPTLMMREPTLEAIQKGFRCGLPSQGLFSDEGGQFFGGHAMGRDNQLKTITGLSDLWGGKPIIRSRAENGESFSLYNRRLSAHLMIQPIVAETVLSDSLMAGQGFMARFLLAWTESLAGTRLYNHRDSSKEPALVTYNQVMLDLLEREHTTDEEGEPAPVNIVLSEDAKKHWVDAYNTIEVSLAAHGLLEEIKPTASKASENMARIAAVLTLTSNPNASTIELCDMQRAAALTEHYLQEALRLNRVAESDVMLSRAKVLLDWLHTKRCKRISLALLSKGAPSGTRARSNVNAIRRLAAILVDHHWLHPLPDGVVVDGKPVKEAWEVQHV